jgi:hypothetical protein
MMAVAEEAREIQRKEDSRRQMEIEKEIERERKRE